MATAAEHYAQAERYLGAAEEYDTEDHLGRWYLAAAQVHATLALAPAAVADESEPETPVRISA